MVVGRDNRRRVGFPVQVISGRVCGGCGGGGDGGFPVLAAFGLGGLVGLRFELSSS
jgi:hypothetical protein